MFPCSHPKSVNCRYHFRLYDVIIGAGLASAAAAAVVVAGQRRALEFKKFPNRKRFLLLLVVAAAAEHLLSRRRRLLGQLRSGSFGLGRSRRRVGLVVLERDVDAQVTEVWKRRTADLLGFKSPNF